MASRVVGASKQAGAAAHAKSRGFTQAEQELIRDQVERLAESELFINSRRLPAFLRFIVEKSLRGETDDLKERLIGVEIFGRAPDYDCSSSPVVRVTAVDLRKRLEGYYQQAGHSHELVISLHTGSYVPSFYKPNGLPLVGVSEALPEVSPLPRGAKAGAGTGGVVSKETRAARLNRRTAYLACCAALALAVSVAWFYRGPGNPNILDQFWGPILASPEPVALCFTQGMGTAPFEGVVPTDVETMGQIRDLIESRHRNPRVVDAGSADLAHLKNEPVIYLGPSSTPWLQQVAGSLPYRIVRDPGTKSAWVENHADNYQQRWVQTVGTGNSRTQTFAILARYTDRASLQPVILISGIWPEGTVAAGEVLTQREYMEMLLKNAPAGWQKMNLEAVIRTDIVAGKAANQPQVEAVYFWK